MRKLYPTMDDFETFLEQVQLATSEFGTRIQTLLLSLPFEQQLELISFFSDYVAEKWGNDIADDYAIQLMTTLDW